MAVPWINLLAPSMGGIGPIRSPDLDRVNALKQKSGVPFYAGRFYPKGSQEFINNLYDFGFNSELPPWLTWAPIDLTQIWMVPVFEDERVVSTQTQIERIDVWPRLPGDDLPEWENTSRDNLAQLRGWGQITGAGNLGMNAASIDPSVIVRNNLVPPLLFAGYVGISGIEGRCSEYAFYDQELHIINGQRYGQDLRSTAISQGYDPDQYYELIRIREDGAWIKKTTSLPATGQLNLADDDEDGYPRLRGPGEWRNNEYPAENYQNWVNSDYSKAKTYGNNYWDFFTKWNGANPKAGLIMGIKPSEIDCVVYTIKVSCVTVVVPDDPSPANVQEALRSYSNEALETFGSNLTNNVWYFYWPIRFNGNEQVDRGDFLLNRAGINKLRNPNYVAPA